jgi:hypothetical protein
MTKRTLFRVLIALPFLGIAFIFLVLFWSQYRLEVFREQGERLVALNRKLTPACKLELDPLKNDQLIAGVVITRHRSSDCGTGMACEWTTRQQEPSIWTNQFLWDIRQIVAPEAKYRKSAISASCLDEVRAIFKHTETASTISINF